MNWEFVSAISAAISAFASTALSIVVIRQTQKISKQQIETQQSIADKDLEAARLQRKIDTFDKRYELYRSLNSLISTVSALRHMYDPDFIEQYPTDIIPSTYSNWVENYLFNNATHPKAFRISNDLQEVNNIHRYTSKLNSEKHRMVTERILRLSQERIMFGIEELSADVAPLLLSEFFLVPEISNLLSNFADQYINFAYALFDDDGRNQLDNFQSKEAELLFSTLTKIESESTLDAIKTIMRFDSSEV